MKTSLLVRCASLVCGLLLAGPGFADEPGPTATLVIVTTPEQAGVHLNNSPDRSAFSPANLPVPAGQVLSVTLKLDGFKPQTKSFTPKPNEVLLWEATLQALQPPLIVVTAPGAEIIAYDAADKGIRLGLANDQGRLESTGKLIDGIPYRIEATLAGYEKAAAQSVKVSPDESVNLRLDLQPKPGKIVVSAVPLNAEVFVNNRKAGAVGATLDVPADEKITVEVRLPGYRAGAPQAVTLAKEEVKRLDFGELTRVAGAVKVTIKTSAGEVSPEVYSTALFLVDGRDVTVTNGVIENLPPGERKIRVIHPDYVPEDDSTVVVREKAETAITLTLTLKETLLHVETTPKVPYALEINDKVVEGRGGDFVVPPRQSLRVKLTAQGYLPATTTVDGVEAGDVSSWRPKLEVDQNAVQLAKEQQEQQRLANLGGELDRQLVVYERTIRSAGRPFTAKMVTQNIAALERMEKYYAEILPRQPSLRTRINALKTYLNSNQVRSNDRKVPPM